MTEAISRAEHPGSSLWDLPWFFAGALVYLSFGFTEMMGSDLWWHLAAGREMWEQGTVRLLDSWSYKEAGTPWRNHEWLADLVFHGWVQIFGVEALVYWKWLLLILTYGLLQRVLLRICSCPGAALLAAIAAVAVAAPFLDIRPQLYSLLGAAVLLNLALWRKPRLWELLLLFLVWVNLHGGFLFGLMALGILVFPWRDWSLPAMWRSTGLVLACAAVALLNPDGINAYAYPLEYALNADSPYRSLGEWRPPFESGGIRSPLYLGALIVGGLCAALWLLPVVRRVVLLIPEALALGALTAAMSLTSRRFVILYALALGLLLAPFLAALFRLRLQRKLQWTVLGLALVFGVYRLSPFSLKPAVAFHYLTAEYAFPHAVTEFVALNELRGPTFAYYNWGGFLHWKGNGSLQVFIDGRANTIYDDETYNTYVSILGRKPGWQERMEATGAKLFLWPRGRGGQRLLEQLLESRRWILLYQDNRGVLLAHTSYPLPSALQRPRESFHSTLADAYVAQRRGDPRRAQEAAERAYEQRPWDLGACRAITLARQIQGDQTGAEEVVSDCRSRFASRYLQ